MIAPGSVRPYLRSLLNDPASEDRLMNYESQTGAFRFCRSAAVISELQNWLRRIVLARASVVRSPPLGAIGR